MVSEWVVLVHVAVSFWFVAGLLGRNVTCSCRTARLFESALEDAKQRGQVTPELQTALRDPAVRNARATEPWSSW